MIIYSKIRKAIGIQPLNDDENIQAYLTHICTTSSTSHKHPTLLFPVFPSTFL